MANCILGGTTSAKFSERFGALLVSVQGSSGTLQHGTSYTDSSHAKHIETLDWTSTKGSIPRVLWARPFTPISRHTGLLPGNSSRRLLALPGVDLACAGLQLLGMAQTGLSAQVGESRLCNEAFQWAAGRMGACQQPAPPLTAAPQVHPAKCKQAPLTNPTENEQQPLASVA